jgi:hypothetical protein
VSMKQAERLLSLLYTWAILAAFVHFIVLPVAQSVTVQGYAPQPWAVVGIYILEGIFAWKMTGPGK